MKDTQRMQNVLINWALNYKKGTIKRSQKEVAVEIAKSKQMSQGFSTWRNVYIKRVMKNNLNQKTHQFRRERNLRKYFSKMLNVFYSL
jgi:transposase